MLKFTIYSVIVVSLFTFFNMGNRVSANAVTTAPKASSSSSSSSLWPSDDDDSLSIIPESDMRSLDRNIWIITTAALPWMTGTSVNPMLRAAALATDRPKGKVTLMVPWLDLEDQHFVFNSKTRFEDPVEQKEVMIKWLKEAGLEKAAEKLEIKFYVGKYHDEYHSIFPMGDILSLIPDESADVCVLEEPEHLNWYRAPFTHSKPWTEKFKHVIGIIHTNYLHYSRTQPGGVVKEPLLYYVNQLMCRAHTHKIIKLSNALQEFAPEKEVTSNVHGVREKYLKIGDEVGRSLERGDKAFQNDVYFVGKLAWQKGIDSLFDYMKHIIKEREGRNCFHIDIFGSGPHEGEIKTAATNAHLPVTFHGAKDHASILSHKIFVNPSLSEVLCTTIIEALAMGKFVICPEHPSNEFFYQFPNCLTYATQEEFGHQVEYALHHNPHKLSDEHRYALTWEAATERLIKASMLTKEMQKNSKLLTDKFARSVHDMLSNGPAGDAFRSAFGAKDAAAQFKYMRRFGSASPTSRSSDHLQDLVSDSVNCLGNDDDMSGKVVEGNVHIVKSDDDNDTNDDDSSSSNIIDNNLKI